MSHPLSHDHATPTDTTSTSTSTPTPTDTASDDSDNFVVLKARPHRPFELSSPPPSAPTTPPLEQPTSYLQAPPTPNTTSTAMDGSTTPNRTRSFLNLTSSTLFGIYQPTGYSAERDDSQTPTWGAATPWSGSTPWGTGAQTPAERSPISRVNSMDWTRSSVPDAAMPNGGPASRKDGEQRRQNVAPPRPRPHHMPRRGFKGLVLPVVMRASTMFGIGVLYALLITHLHDRRGVAPVRVELDRESWTYFLLWGGAGILLGEALPWADRFWASDPENEHADQARQSKDPRRQKQQPGRRQVSGLDGWLDVIRSIGAFVGIAFAIRKLPWQSTTQLSLTLALANPALWYLIDRSPPGFILSTIVALTGTAMLLVVNPALMPSPNPAQVLRGIVARNSGHAGGNAGKAWGSEELVLGVFSPESLGVATWIASVFFVSAVCFGNIGRRLARESSKR